jgi:tetratricopeptide (TPR) repeat protein
MLGMVKQEGGDRRGALAAYERALARDPNDGVAANNLAWLYAESNRLEDALALATRANAALNNASQTLDTLGWIHHLAGRQDEAIHAFRAALEKQPDNPTYHYHLGAAYAQAGHPAAARTSALQALRLSERFPEAAAARKLLATLPASLGPR